MRKTIIGDRDMRITHLNSLNDAIDLAEPAADEIEHARRWFDILTLPYYLEKLSNGRWALINRNNKPLGNPTREWVDHNEAPSFAFDISDAVAAKLSGSPATTSTRIYLTDGPIGGPDYWKRLTYLVRLIETTERS